MDAVQHGENFEAEVLPVRFRVWPAKEARGGPGEPGQSLRGARGMIFGLRKAFGNNFLHFFAFLRAKFENQLGKKGVAR